MATTTKPIRIPHMTGTYHKGFTLIELLTVIAIIGILAGILIPVIGSAQTSALRAKARAQFNGYAMAITEYRNEYGFYPLDMSGSESTLNEDFTGNDFRLALTGRGSDGTVDNTHNRRARPFYSFSSSEFLMDNNNDVIEPIVIVDPFDNPNIHFVVDANNSGSIDNPFGSGDIHIKVGVYTNPTTNEKEQNGWLEIKNW